MGEMLISEMKHQVVMEMYRRWVEMYRRGVEV